MNNKRIIESIEEHFGDLPDQRVGGRCDYRLIDLIIIAVCASITGADSWVEVAEFADTHQTWLRQFMVLGETIPSHDTFGRVFALLNAGAFHQRFAGWVRSVFPFSRGQTIAIDGKTSCGSADEGIGKEALHTVSAWASENGIVLGQVATDAKSNEITAIPQLLDLLDVRGCVVTIDAMGTQKKIAEQIRQQQADYVLALKDNQGRLYDMVRDVFAYGDNVAFAQMNVQTHQTINKLHGRIEVRRCQALSDSHLLATFQSEGWTDLTSVGRILRERRFPDHVETETVYFISSLPNDANRLLSAVRSHWTVENQLHWVLDVQFHEDDARIRAGDGAENMAVVRHMALNILKRDTSKGSVRVKRYRAAMNTAFLESLLALI